MEENNNNQMVEDSSSGEQTATQGMSVDYEALYNKEVANAKKQRNRAQELESTLKQHNENTEKAKMKQFAEDGKLTELVDTQKSQIDKLQNELNQNSAIVSTLRNEMLANIPEEEQEALKDLPFNALKLVVDKISAKTKTALPNTTPTVKSPMVPTKPYAEMSKAEKQSYHAQVIANRGNS